MVSSAVHMFLILWIAVVWGIQSVVWWNFFFRTNHPGPKQIIIANHFSFFGSLLLTIPGVFIMGSNMDQFGWYTLLYGLSALIEGGSTYYANEAITIRRAEVRRMENEVEEAKKRLQYLRARRELIARG